MVHMAVPVLVIWEVSKLSFIVVHKFKFSLKVPFLYILANIWQLCCFWQLFWQGWGNISLWFWFAFLWWLVMLSIFSCASHLHLLFRKNVCLVPLHTFDWVVVVLFCFLVVSCLSCLCMLGVNPLSVIRSSNIFSHSVGCLILSTVLFAVQSF